MGSVTWLAACPLLCPKFQLTRSVGSVTRIRLGHTNSIRISTHTLRGERDSISYNCSPTPITWFQLTRSVGSVTSSRFAANKLICISTHTLRGERDFFRDYLCMTVFHFNSHAPWGAWHMFYLSFTANIYISTHTLRGERDSAELFRPKKRIDFNSHAPWGAWLWKGANCKRCRLFQLTRSVGNVTICNFFLTNM